MEIHEIVRYARGDKLPELVLRNARVVDVLGGEIIETNVAIAHSRIVALGDYEGEKSIDVQGAFVAPGFIDAHVHIESAMVPPSEFARAVVPRGTTTVITDPHEIANVLGLEGIRFMFESAKYGPLSMFVMAPSCVPATHMETNGSQLQWYDLVSLQSDPWVLGLAEVMNYPGVVSGDDRVLDKLRVFRDTVIDGHAPALSGKALQAYVAAGVSSDHECMTVEEAREKLRAGMVIFMREATNAHNLKSLLPLVTPFNHHRICFCTDDRQPADLLDQGHIDYMVRTAIAEGIDPFIALRMASWNAAQHFRLYDRGAVAPGMRADLIVFEDLQAPRPSLVFRGGKMVAKDGQMTWPKRELPPRAVRHSMNVAWDQVDFAIPIEGEKARVIGLVPNQLITHQLVETVPGNNGLAHSDVERDILKMAVIERHQHSGNMGKGFVQGLGLKHGALASSIAHDHHNIVVIGVDDDSMMEATRRVVDMGGGIVVADGERVLAEVPLPIGGLMSHEPIDIVRTQVDRALKAAQELGSALHDPFMAMSFLALEVIPSLKLTDQGLVDVDQFAFVPLWV